jgi:uncharacterized membrane protein YqaE (UPF0057 family)
VGPLVPPYGRNVILIAGVCERDCITRQLLCIFRSYSFPAYVWYIYILVFIYLTAVGLTPGGSSTVHIYTQTVHRIQRKEIWEVPAVPRLCELYRAVCLTAEEKALKNLS